MTDVANPSGVAMHAGADKFFRALRDAGMRDVPERFSVALLHQMISRQTFTDIQAFIAVVDRVTTRPAWQNAVTAAAPEIARQARPEVCFFSAWDFHLPPGRADQWQLIECNDNGSGFLFAALINHLYDELWRPRFEGAPVFAAFTEHVIRMVEAEYQAVFHEPPSAMFLIVDDEDSLRSGRFRDELFLLRDLFRVRGWAAEVAGAADTEWDGARLRHRAREVRFVVNRSTDFFWQSDAFRSLRAAYHAGRTYVAPNPFTYATRSDKRLLEWLSQPEWDATFGIQDDERRLLSLHVPTTHLLREDNLEALVRQKDDFVFKPAHGFASRGVLPARHVGRSRLRRLLKHGEEYVAQRRVPKCEVRIDDVVLWTDLRAWAYRGECFLLSGRASRRPDLLDLLPPGGWLATYVGAA